MHVACIGLFMKKIYYEKEILVIFGRTSLIFSEDYEKEKVFVS